MPRFILKFSVCRRVIKNYKDVVEYLQTSLNGVQSVSFELNDDMFTMEIHSKNRIEALIQKQLRLKGMEAKFLTLTEI